MTPADQKLNLEIKKLVQDSGWRSYLTPLASAAFALLSISVTFWQFQEVRGKNKADRFIACTNATVSVTDLAARLAVVMNALPMEQRVNYAERVAKPFPTDVALQLVTLLGAEIPPDESASALQLKAKIEKLEKGAQCPHS